MHTMHTNCSTEAHRPVWKLGAGFLLGLIFPLVLAEMFVRMHPPADIQEFLGDDSPLQGCYQRDPVLGADYKSYECIRQKYAVRLDELGSLTLPGSTWAWFGNSFVQAPGMLGDTATAAMPGTRMFYLKQNEPLYLRIAQARLLLKNGLRPQRLIFAFHPVDTLYLCRQPLSSIYVNDHGAITYRPRRQSGLSGTLMRHSRLALIPWLRSGQQVAKPSYRPHKVTSYVPTWLAADLRSFVRMLGDMSREYGTTVTVLLIPNRGQVFGEAKFALQDALSAMCREQQIDCCDVGQVFLEATEKPSLFLPDWHFSLRGNQLLWNALQTHLEATEKEKGNGK